MVRDVDEAELPVKHTSNKTVSAADLWLGLQLRTMRKAAKLSMTDLAQKANLSVGMISQIERGVASPSIRSLRQISDALGVAPAEFFKDGLQPPLEEMGKIVRKSARRQLSLSRNGVSKQLLTPDLDGATEMLLVIISPGGTSGPEHYVHKGEDAGLVLSGTLELWIDGCKHLLHEGDSFRFRSSLPHRFSNPGQSETEVLWVITPPLY
ncbi:cupin domain-containing protein [Rhodoligotrophos ferricapiens]|uniref:cupin domain-containing protein n=1 Tax=Rhodoligotrophos ferricapiens TaxID=3069264 RepID=UPI00315DE88A